MKQLLNKAKSFKTEILVCRILAVVFILMGLIMANVSCSLNSVGIKGNGYLTAILSLGSFACSIFLLDYSKYRVNVYEKALNSEDGYTVEIMKGTVEFRTATEYSIALENGETTSIGIPKSGSEVLERKDECEIAVARDPEGNILLTCLVRERENR